MVVLQLVKEIITYQQLTLGTETELMKTKSNQE